jgi:hypothetical protein
VYDGKGKLELHLRASAPSCSASLPSNDRDHPVAASDVVKWKKRNTATRRASLCSALFAIGLKRGTTANIGTEF